MEQKTEASQAVDELLDNDGENRAVRTFLMQYSCDRSTTVGAMLAHMNRAGWRGYAPSFALDVRPESHLTKAGAQIWIRHLMSLEPAALKAQPAPTEAQARPDFSKFATIEEWQVAMSKWSLNTAIAKSPTEARPLHEEIVREEGMLVCTACGTTSKEPAWEKLPEVDFEDDSPGAPTEAAQGAQSSGNSGELQPSGNTGELAQGEDSARLDAACDCDSPSWCKNYNRCHRQVCGFPLRGTTPKPV